jgi:glycosyltransferase involved in cell wall biosynthesis
MKDIAPLICFSTADWDAPLWTNKQHLMSRLAARGIPVLYLDSLGLREPGLGATDLARMARRVVDWRPFASATPSGVLRDRPMVVPLHRYRGARAINESLLAKRLKRNERRHRLGGALIWTYSPNGGEAFDSRRHRALVYHCVDDLAAYPGIEERSFRARERALVELSSVCIASSRPLVHHLERLGARDIRYWPNPADVDSYSQARLVARTRNSRPIIGFIGAVQEHKVDTELVAAFARERPDWRVRLVGPVGIGLSRTGISADLFPSNVELVGHVPREELPDEVATFDVGIIPYRQNAYTAGVFPMKIFEYLGAGVPVVSTPLPSLVGEVNHVAFASDASGFVTAIDQALSSGAHHEEDRRAYASRFSWTRRTDQAVELIQSLSQ